MIKVRYNYIQFCYGNDRDYYRKPKLKEKEFSNENEAQEFIDNLKRINKLPNQDKYENIELLKEDYVPAPDEDENGNLNLDYGYSEEAQRRDEIIKQTKLAKKRFETLCNETGREHLLYEEGGIEGWTLRDFVSEAYYQFDMRRDSWDPELKKEGKQWLRFVQRFQSYLDKDIKCTQEHISKYDLM